MRQKIREYHLAKFQGLLAVGVQRVSMNINNGHSALVGLYEHLTLINSHEYQNTVDTKNCFDACKYWAKNHIEEGLNCDNALLQKISKSYLDGKGIQIPIESVNCKIPDGWVVVVKKGQNLWCPDNFRVFSSWHSKNIYNLSSGTDDLASLKDFGGYFIWQQRSGTRYKLFKNRSGHLTDLAQSILNKDILGYTSQLEVSI